jgi:HTH-type transcriptional regulator, glycine betaine synthesis regulator
MTEPSNDQDPQDDSADDARAQAASGAELWESERIVSDAIGRLMVLWGFKRNMGRVWTLLYLSNEPLTAFELRERLQLSAGAISMTLNELARWGVVHKVFRQGDRHDYYEAESSLWKMISRVLRERELSEVDHTIEALEDALSGLKRRSVAHTGRTSKDAQRSETQQQRIEQLLELARLGRSMLDALINHARMDASWLPRFRFGRSER